MMPRKTAEKYTPTDIIQIWKVEFRKITNSNYASAASPFNEIKLARALLDNYGVYHVLLSISAAIKSGIVTFKEFFEQYELIMPDTQYAELTYYVQKNGDGEIKNKWRRLMMLESEWLQTPEVKIRRGILENELSGWLAMVKK